MTSAFWLEDEDGEMVGASAYGMGDTVEDAYFALLTEMGY